MGLTQRGFVLLEAIIALVVSAVGLLGVALFTSSMVGESSNAKSEAEALAIAQRENIYSSQKYLNKHLSKIAYFESVFITKNSLMLANSFGLDENAHKLITFVIAISLSPSLRTLIEITTGFSESRIFDLVEEVTAIETTKLEHFKQELLKSGLFSLSDYNDMSDLFDMNKQLACVLVSEELSNHDELLNHILFPSSKCLLKQSDFKHMDLFSLKHFIANAKKQGDKGINILIYGAPGTGKSQFAQLIAEAIRLKLFEVKAIGDDLYKFQSEVYSGEPSSKLRLQYLKLINFSF